MLFYCHRYSMSTGGTFILQTMGQQDQLLYGGYEGIKGIVGGKEDPNLTEVSANEVLPGLWIGNQASSQDIEWLRKNNIKTIVNATKHIPFANIRTVQIRVPVNDPGPFNALSQKDVAAMYKALPCVVDMINHSLSKGGVLVHCHAGMQRSAAIVSAYLAKYFSQNADGGPKNGKSDLYKRSTDFLYKKRNRVFYNGWYVNFQAAIKRYIANMDSPKMAKCLANSKKD